MARPEQSRKKTADKNLTPQQEAARKHRKRRILLRVGQALLVLGVLVMVQHWLTHLEAFGPGQPPGWVDLVAGYPMGFILLIAGALVAGSKPK